ncbi:MAG: hypothetical protein KatS3mg002_1636 [Candidatus Woesearchaeota archaeon]|nr:MAG: hypothetical protein KatS3mg002_1636 [Candidatus Woesearchaeota archaeon]
MNLAELLDNEKPSEEAIKKAKEQKEKEYYSIK